MHKPSPFRYLLLILPVAIIILLAYFVRQQMARMAGLETVAPTAVAEATEGPLVVDPGIQKSVDDAVALLKAQNPGYLLYNVEINNVVYSDDGNTVEVWLAALDPDTGEVMAREPEIAVAQKNPNGQKGTASEWSVTLPYDPNYENVIKSLPDGVLGEDFQQRFQTKYPDSKTAATFGGYYLPWAGGQTKRLTWSISHASCSGSACKYAFDFADGTMFPILAAKGGTVFATQTTCANGGTKCTNYVILKDNSTTPTSYQIYYHLAKNTTPEELRKVGAVVKQGQFIGNADDTGASTANHLHFMVHTNSYGYWGNSVDITFKDVSINYDKTTGGGRPRMPSEATKYGGEGQTYYKSGNSSTGSPTGNITSPAEGAVVNTQLLTVTGTGTDDRGITKVQLQALYDNAWHDVGTPATTGNFTIGVDMCSAGIPDGPVSLAIKLWDVEGNQTTGLVGLRGIVKNYRCTPITVVHACQPTKDQVALYTTENYSGTCKIYNTGDYSSMSGIAGSDVASVLVGSNVQISMWSGASYKGRSETLITSDPDLADNVMDRDTVNSFKVKSISNAVGVPVITYPTSTTALTSDSPITLAWNDGGYTNEFQGELSGTNGFTTRTSEWDHATSWNVGSLPAGTFTLKVHGRNTANGKVSAYATATFTVMAATVSNTATETAPWTDTFESGASSWTATGLWNLSTARSTSASHAWFYGRVEDSAFRYGTGYRGTLTSPVVKIPAKGYYLHFFYRYSTESTARYWDQRRVQISVDGAPFVNLYQFSADPRNSWLQSPAIDLSAYANHNVRIRFSFDTIDDLLNVGEGWYIDDVLVNQNGPATGCLESSRNDTPATASAIAINQPQAGDICPGGDVDYYKFTAKAGERLTFDIDAQVLGSQLDSVLWLVGPDGSTVLGNSDDEVTGQVKDSLIYTMMPADGTYYLRVQAWNHPLAGGANNTYVLRMYNDTTPPTASMAYPTSGTLVPNGNFYVTVNASDGSGSGVGHVVFYWHDHNWTSGKWAKIGEDWNGTDGWRILFNPTPSVGKGTQGAIYAQVFDNAGNYNGASSWEIQTDPSQAPPPVPTSDMIPFGGTTSALNTVLVQWNANDVGAGIAAFEFQIQENGGTWQTWVPEGVSAASRSAWFIGTMGKTYGFRMRVIDGSGAKEDWPANAEASITLNGCTSGVDVSENDNNLASAKENLVEGDHVVHTFCGQNDEDWIKFTAVKNELYFINALPSNLAEAAVLTVYDTNGKALAQLFPTQLGAPTTLRWTAPGSGTFYVKARNYNPLIAGDGAVYQMWINQGVLTYVPMVIQ
jgi:murein DD-endopeptidase MepM/ murein hydrolase activator NlpD